MITYSKSTVTALLKKPEKSLMEQPWMAFYDPGYSINELREMYPDFFWEKGGGAWYQQEDFANLTEKSCMRTMLMEPLIGSLNKNWEGQQKLIPKNCEIPLARQVLVMCVLHFQKTEEYLLTHQCVRCRDLSLVGSLVCAGECNPGGILGVLLSRL